MLKVQQQQLVSGKAEVKIQFSSPPSMRFRLSHIMLFLTSPTSLKSFFSFFKYDILLPLRAKDHGRCPCFVQKKHCLAQR